jgi:hypothetical protein
MTSRPSLLRTVSGGALVCAAALALSACVVAPVGPYPRGGYAYGEAVVVAPPPLQVEAVGVAPYPGYVWIGGNWTWSGGRHVWVPGRWSAPRPGYYWEPHRWERRDGRGWYERPGRWERR